MSLPRTVSGERLASLLRRRYGYEVVRQRGSHMRLVAQTDGGEHRVTVPRHRELRIGTLNAILWEVASSRGVHRDDVVADLFG
ncbi:MAG: type II toxin-antitoxin system HicA family toxin [Chloroflexi bacterium]|nr:type II toxin-antitoxin system HicA family toxin [Chloroflexota bacterium]